MTLAALLLALAGCSSPLSPEAVGADEFRPLPEYMAWAGELLECAGSSVSPAALVGGVRWVQAEDLRPGRGTFTAGMYSRLGGPTIYLHRQWLRVEPLVKHELTHHLEWLATGDADGEHARASWRCQYL